VRQETSFEHKSNQFRELLFTFFSTRNSKKKKKKKRITKKLILQKSQAIGPIMQRKWSENIGPTQSYYS